MKGMFLRIFADMFNPEGIPCADGNCKQDAIVPTVLVWAYFIIGAVAAIIIIYAGIQYSISGGAPEKTKRAKDTILYTIVGLIVAVLATTIIGFITGAFS